MSELRFDKVFIPKVENTPEGFLQGEAIVTRLGVFKYFNADGSERLELRHPDDVLHPDSLATLRSKPITEDHPNVMVTSENVDSFMVGLTGEDVKVDENLISTSLTITHKKAITAINNGKREFSLGYTLDTIPEEGVYNNEKYTYRQTNIRYNHLALVDAGRAGRAARINFDSVDFQNILFQGDELTNEKGSNMTTKEKINKDDLTKEIQVDSEANLDVQIRFDKMQASIDHLRTENAELKAARVDSIINERVEQRFNILNKASKVINIDNLSDKSDREIMEAVILAKDVNLDVAEKHNAYVEGRFDAIVESVGDESIAQQMSNLNKTNKNNDSKSLLSVMKEYQNRSK